MVIKVLYKVFSVKTLCNIFSIYNKIKKFKLMFIKNLEYCVKEKAVFVCMYVSHFTQILVCGAMKVR